MRLFIITLTAIIMMFSTQSANACSCALEVSRFSEIFEDTDIVFKGRAIDTRNYISQSKSVFERQTRFKVIETYQGKLRGVTAVLHNGSKTSSCGIKFKPKDMVVVYAAKMKSGGYRTHLCMQEALSSSLDRPTEKEMFDDYIERGQNELAIPEKCGFFGPRGSERTSEDYKICKSAVIDVLNYERRNTAEKRLEDYFKFGRDSWVKNDFCEVLIKQAYDLEVFTGKFELDEKCRQQVPYYDSIFRSRAEED